MTSIAVAPARTGAILHWRYGGDPARYAFLVARDGVTLRGCAVLRRPRDVSDPRLNGLRVATLSDLVAPPDDRAAVLALVLVMCGVGFKISAAPFHLWTPDAYEGAPAPVVAFLSTASKGAAIVFLLLLLPYGKGFSLLHTPLWWLSLFSMLLGNLAALLQTNLKRMLAYSSIAQMGYVALALLTGSSEGSSAVVFYLVVYTAMNLAAFGAVASLTGAAGMEAVADYRGLGYSRPFQAGVLALAMFALAGIPPTAGFIGKFFIFYAAVRGGELPLAIIGILTAAISAYYYLRVVVNLYMRPAEAPESRESASAMIVLAR